MRHCLYILLFALFSLTVSTSCIQKDAVKIHGLSDVNISLGNSPAINFIVNAENSSGRNITISNASLELFDANGNRIAKVLVVNNIFLPKRSVTDVKVPLRLSVDNPLVGMAMLSKFEKNVKLLHVSGNATITAGCFRKKIKIERMPLTDFINRFGGQSTLNKYYKAA